MIKDSPSGMPGRYGKKRLEQGGFCLCDRGCFMSIILLGHAIISRILEANGYRVGIISQPDWKNKKSIDVFGRPRLGFLISGEIWILW